MNAALRHSDDENSLRYPGWGVLAAAFTGVMVSFAPIVPYTFSLFLDPLHAAFGWKREAMGAAFALAAITVGLVSPLIGILLDHFPPSRVILPAKQIPVPASQCLEKLLSDFLLLLISGHRSPFHVRVLSNPHLDQQRDRIDTRRAAASIILALIIKISGKTFAQLFALAGRKPVSRPASVLRGVEGFI